MLLRVVMNEAGLWRSSWRNRLLMWTVNLELYHFFLSIFQFQNEYKSCGLFLCFVFLYRPLTTHYLWDERAYCVPFDWLRQRQKMNFRSFYNFIIFHARTNCRTVIITAATLCREQHSVTKHLPLALLWPSKRCSGQLCRLRLESCGFSMRAKFESVRS